MLRHTAARRSVQAPSSFHLLVAAVVTQWPRSPEDEGSVGSVECRAARIPRRKLASNGVMRMAPKSSSSAREAR